MKPSIIVKRLIRLNYIRGNLSLMFVIDWSFKLFWSHISHLSLRLVTIWFFKFWSHISPFKFLNIFYLVLLSHHRFCNVLCLYLFQDNKYVLKIRLKCNFDPLSFKKLRFWPPNFENYNFGPLILKTAEKATRVQKNGPFWKDKGS